MILGSRRRYVGPVDRVLTDRMVVLLAIHRDGRRLERDADVECIRADDVIEVAPLVRFEDGHERPSCVAHEVPPSSLA